MPSSSDRNLLIGVMAVQLDFITRDQLVSAMGAWVLDKDKSLDKILIEQHALDADIQTLLLSVVDKHVEQHDGDSRKSLATVSTVESVRQELESLADEDIDDSLGYTTFAAGSEPQFSATSGEGTGELTALASHSQRFRVLRPHAQGGLGEVSLALDEELNREVALKQIQQRFADDENSRARFVVEAEITGGLEHPGIVPVYGLGQYDDGRPYYAMRFIRGDSFKVAANRFHRTTWPDDHARALEFRRLLDRFVDVCNAIEYAHSRGVLHRDLKPSNIMLGKYGETLVVDWGLAKPEAAAERADIASIPGPLIPSSGSGAALTIGGSVIGTPHFMSPEQAAGSFGEMGPASDVYSLGATLYYLLTGKAPFDDDESDSKPNVAKLLSRVQQGDYSRPREINQIAPQPLESICIKAMSIRPEDRYASPSALAKDIEHWLADEPTSAHPESLATRARRWIKWHQTLVTSGAAAVLVAVVCLGSLLAIVAGMNQQLAAVNTQLRASNEREQRARMSADRQSEIANTQRKLALDTLSSVIFDIQDGLRSFPAARQVRLSLLESALDGLQQVEASLDTQPQVDLNTAVAYHELGRIFFGVGDELSSGGTSSAARVFQNEYDIARKLYEDDPDDPAVMRLWADANSDVGRVSLNMGKTDRAGQLFEESYKTIQRLCAKDNDIRHRRVLARVLDDMGTVGVRQGRSEDAAKYFTKGLEIQRELARADPGISSQENLASALFSVSEYYEQMNQIDQAITCARDALTIRQSCQNELPEDISRKYSSSATYWHLSKLLFRQAELSQAQENVEHAIKIGKEVTAADAKTFQYQQHLARAYYTLGDVLLSKGRAEQSLANLKQSVELLKELIAENPGDTRPLYGAANALEKLGDIRRQMTQYDDSAGHFREQVQLLTDLTNMDPTNTLYRRDLSLAYNRLGNVYLQQKSFDDALSWYNKGLDIIKKLRENDPVDERLRRDLSFSYNKIGDTHFHAGQNEKSLEAYAKGIEIRQSLAKDHPDDTRGIQDLGVSLERMGNVNVNLGKLDDAINYYNRCLKIRRDLADKHPENIQYQRYVANTLANMGAVFAGQEDYAGAIRHSEQSLDIFRKLLKDGKLAPRYQSTITVLEKAIEEYGSEASEEDQQ